MQAKFKASYMGTVWYMVTSREYCAEIEVRHSLGDYERSIANGADVVRDMESQIGLACDGLNAPPALAIDAINDYRLSNWQQAMDRFPDFPEPKPEPVAAGRYVSGLGWQRVGA
jgi:hypothetical protein